MDYALKIANWLLPLLYLAMLIDYGATFFLRVRIRARSLGLVAVAGIHSAFLIARSIHLGVPPTSNNPEILSLMAFCVIVVYGLVEMRVRDRRAGVFIFLVAFLFQYTSSLLIAETVARAPESAQYGWARLHVLPASFAYTALTLAGVYGFLHLLAMRNFKRHGFGMLFDRLPPIELLGRMTWRALLVGLVFITISMVTGPLLFMRANSVEHVQMWDPKVATKILVGSVSWLICMVAAIGRVTGRFSITRVSWVAVAGFLIIIALLASSVILS